MKPLTLFAAIIKVVILMLLLLSLAPAGSLSGQPTSSRRPGSVPSLPDWWRYETGKSYFSESGFIEYIPGDAPVILSVPHGGVLEPGHIPDRNGVTAHDTNTLELSRLYADAYYELTGRRPHTVMNLLHRRKLDANRDLVEAAEGNADSEKAWHEFHAYIEQAKDLATDMYGWGFYIDLHGHGHAHQRVELGYGLSDDDLRLSDHALNSATIASRSTIGAICESKGTETRLAALLRGPMSFGAILERQQVPSVPSDVQPAPLPGWGYFSGGYNTKRHGARDGGPVNGLQVEVSSDWRRERGARQYFAQALARTTVEFLAHHAGLEACDAPIRARVQSADGTWSVLPGAVLTGPAKVAIKVRDIAVGAVRVELDGSPVYQGDGLPDRILLDPSELAHGSHVLDVNVVDGNGESHHYEATFHVRHFQIRAPWHGGPLEAIVRVAGAFALDIQPKIPPEQLRTLVVRLKGAAPATDRDYTLANESEWPARVEVDTRRFEDGIYDLVVSAETAAGIRTQQTERLEIKNWVVLEDPLFPPKVGGWLGKVEMLKAVRKSDGWVYATDRAEWFGGDGDRLKPSGATAQYLIWKLENLHRYELTLYAEAPGIHEDVAVSVSADGANWTDVPYRYKAVEPEVFGSRWWKIVVADAVGGDLSASYLRLTLTGKTSSKEGLQLGHVRLVGATRFTDASNEVKK